MVIRDFVMKMILDIFLKTLILNAALKKVCLDMEQRRKQLIG